jgi:hypothetical protein
MSGISVIYPTGVDKVHLNVLQEWWRRRDIFQINISKFMLWRELHEI